MNDFLNITAFLSFLLLIGTFVKSKVKILQELFIPASVIGGIIGLFLNSNFLRQYIEILPSKWEGDIRAIPGVLIIPILVSVPLGMKIEKENKIMKNIVNTGGILFLITFTQLFIGYLVNFIFDKFFRIKLYKSFGAELNSAFAGGHGTAGVVARTLKELGSKYWELAQGVTVTLATIGLICGIIFGIYQIKMKSKTSLKKDILTEYKSGHIKDRTKQKSIGQETMLNTTIDTLAYHLAIVFGVSGLAIISLNMLKKLNIPIVSKITVWSYGMLVMFIVWKIMVKKGLDWSIDSKIKTKITGTLTEFAIVAAVATIPLRGVIGYIFPIVCVSLLGFSLTWIIIFKLSQRYFQDYHLERTLAMFGTSTGVFITGLLLLRICDPKLETPVLQDYSLGFSITALLGPILITLCIQLSFIYNYFYPMSLLISLIVFTVIFLEWYNKGVEI
ncbi:sodium/glutamate symporter [Candidatus Cetobacterium colombiensis]|uniref:Sodium/glutamate symporter n=1 Tax=Candidatus Cetobacterium colombiensis TaxID=3073100 RepID=A0ABU4WG72_9FUSO|nr:sodium/glutamate symporter [Candidatus Cetobacterium colombiensis]MDX8337375.1 sodium/glutamate symporter [Candidatus Cetobacterium colombiensis]